AFIAGIPESISLLAQNSVMYLVCGIVMSVLLLVLYNEGMVRVMVTSIDGDSHDVFEHCSLFVYYYLITLVPMTIFFNLRNYLETVSSRFVTDCMVMLPCVIVSTAVEVVILCMYHFALGQEGSEQDRALVYKAMIVAYVVSQVCLSVLMVLIMIVARGGNLCHYLCYYQWKWGHDSTHPTSSSSSVNPHYAQHARDGEHHALIALTIIYNNNNNNNNNSNSMWWMKMRVLWKNGLQSCCDIMHADFVIAETMGLICIFYDMKCFIAFYVLLFSYKVLCLFLSPFGLTCKNVVVRTLRHPMQVINYGKWSWSASMVLSFTAAITICIIVYCSTDGIFHLYVSGPRAGNTVAQTIATYVKNNIIFMLGCLMSDSLKYTLLGGMIALEKKQLIIFKFAICFCCFLAAIWTPLITAESQNKSFVIKTIWCCLCAASVTYNVVLAIAFYYWVFLHWPIEKSQFDSREKERTNQLSTKKKDLKKQIQCIETGALARIV
ncbi:hypothetical protein RFI_11340, partial [Reticulomyxa filosa]